MAGLLQKQARSRWNWDKFLSHPYLQPSNLSRPTSFLTHSMIAEKEDIVPAQQPAQPAQPAPTTTTTTTTPAAAPAAVKKEGEENGWLQTIYLFHPHGQIITLFLKPVHTVKDVKTTLKSMVNVELSSMMLLNNEGQLLDDGLCLGGSVFNNHDTPVPMYFLQKELFGGFEVPPYQFREALHSMQVIPASPNLHGLTPSDALRAKLGSLCSEKLEHLDKVVANAKHFHSQIALCIRLHDWQHRAYKIAVNHLVAKASEFKASNCKLVDLFKAMSSNCSQYISKKEEVRKQLNSVILCAPFAKAGSPLIELLGIETAKQAFDHVEQWERLPLQVSSFFSLADRMDKEANRLIDQALPKDPLQLLSKALEQASSSYQAAKNALNRYRELLTKELSDLDATLKLSNDRIRAALLSPAIQELEKIYHEISKPASTSQTFTECSAAKNALTQAMAAGMSTIGTNLQILGRSQQQVDDAFVFLAGSQAALVVVKEVFELPQLYDTVLKEVQRRAMFERQLQSVANQLNGKLQTLCEAETIQRKAFLTTTDSTNPFVSYFPAILSPASASIGPVSLEVVKSSIEWPDTDLPIEGHEDLLTQFEKLLEPKDTADERMKRLEKGKANLLSRLGDMRKRVEEETSSQGSERKIEELQTELKSAGACLEQVANAKGNNNNNADAISRLQNQLEEQRKLNENARLHIAKLEHDLARQHQDVARRQLELTNSTKMLLELESKLLASVDKEKLNTLLALSVPELAARRALFSTKNGGLEQALDWLRDHKDGTEILDVTEYFVGKR